MCYFLTISIPNQEIPKVPDGFRREIQFVEQNNPSVRCYLPSDWISFLVISGGCSCGFYRSESKAESGTSKIVAKYRKKGWTDAKIQRALLSRSSSPSVRSGLRDELRNLISILAEDLGELRLSLHWYSGDTEVERFDLCDLGTTSLQEFINDAVVFRDESTLKINRMGASGLREDGI